MARREYQRPAVGECDCFECGRVADVREDKNQSLYYVCLGGSTQDGCGKMTPNTRHGQERLRARTRFFQKEEPGTGDPVPENKAPDPAPAPVPVIAPQKPPVPERTRGVLDRLFNNPVVAI